MTKSGLSKRNKRGLNKRIWLIKEEKRGLTKLYKLGQSKKDKGTSTRGIKK